MQSPGFKEKQKLNRHMLVHTGEKKHACSICGRAFSLRHNLTSHEKIHRGRGMFCRYCGKMYTQVGPSGISQADIPVILSVHICHLFNIPTNIASVNLVMGCPNARAGVGIVEKKTLRATKF